MKHWNRNFALMTACMLTACVLTGCGGSAEDMTATTNKKDTANHQYIQDAPAEGNGEKMEAEVEFDITADISVERNDCFIPYEEPNMEEYNEITENGFRNTLQHPLSTFSVDVDTASYTNVRRMLENGMEVDPDAVRIEEMINYFSYDYAAPTGDAPFSVNTEQYVCPWNQDNQLLLVGLQAEEIDLSERAPMNLVFLIDVSGSMMADNKLPLVQEAFVMLTENLTENDRISIVTYAGAEAVVLEGCAGNDYMTITEKLYSLTAGGSTAGAAGIVRAYDLAEQFFIEGGNNRVILATDGDLNVGLSTEEELTALIEEERESGVNLSVLGFGMGNLKDDRLEALADNGNGNYAYIDSLLEARKVLVQEMGGTLFTVAKDVKIQTEFNPEFVESYRLIGYENRALANEDFADDTVDAGEIGAGHTVTALYELVLTDQAELAMHDMTLKYQENDIANPSDMELMTVSLRYKEPEGTESRLLEYPIAAQESTNRDIPENLAFASAVAEFGMLLRDSEYAGDASLWQINELLGHTDMDNEYRQEFRELAEMAFAGTDKEGEAPEREEGFTDKELADMEEVDKVLSEFLGSDAFQSMSLEERETETRKLLFDLAWYGTEDRPYSLIEERSITYDNYTFSFTHTCGASAAVRIKDFDPMMN